LAIKIINYTKNKLKLRMKKNFLITLLGIISLLNVSAQDNNPVITGVPFLAIAPDARAGGMGDVGAATTADVNSQYWNPAKYPFAESNAGVSLSYTPWLRKLVDDIDLANLTAYFKIGERQAISGSLRYFSLGDISLFNESGENISNAKPNDFSIDFAYSRMFSDKFSGAVALRWIHSDLNIKSDDNYYPGNAVAADIAGYYNTPVTFATGDGRFGLGLNISNIGSKISYDKNETSNFIPTNMRLGASLTYPMDDYNSISFSADINKLLVPNDSTNNNNNDISPISGIFKSFGDAPGGFSEELKEVMWSVGAEYAYNKQFFVRAGYFNEARTKGNRKYFTAGAGFKLNVFQLDVGYVIATSQSNPLDKTLRFSLAFDLDGLRNLVQ